MNLSYFTGGILDAPRNSGCTTGLECLPELANYHETKISKIITKIQSKTYGTTFTVQ